MVRTAVRLLDGLVHRPGHPLERRFGPFHSQSATHRYSLLSVACTSASFNFCSASAVLGPFLTACRLCVISGGRSFPVKYCHLPSALLFFSAVAPACLSPAHRLPAATRRSCLARARNESHPSPQKKSRLGAIVGNIHCSTTKSTDLSPFVLLERLGVPLGCVAGIHHSVSLSSSRRSRPPRLRHIPSSRLVPPAGKPVFRPPCQISVASCYQLERLNCLSEEKKSRTPAQEATGSSFCSVGHLLFFFSSPSGPSLPESLVSVTTLPVSSARSVTACLTGLSPLPSSSHARASRLPFFFFASIIPSTLLWICDPPGDPAFLYFFPSIIHYPYSHRLAPASFISTPFSSFPLAVVPSSLLTHPFSSFLPCLPFYSRPCSLRSAHTTSPRHLSHCD